LNKFFLADITTKIGSGATPIGGQSAYCNNGISLIRSQNVLDFKFSSKGLAFINDEQAEKLNFVSVEKNDVLLNITGDSIARTCLVPENILPARVNQHVSIIRCKEFVDSRYVHYYLQYLKSHLLQICGVGGTRNALTKEALSKLEIVFQDNPEIIAKVLSTLDTKIELNNRINKELEAMAKTLYDYWFVQFDFPDANGKPYKSSGGKMVYNEELKREIPEGWEVKRISDLLNVVTGKEDANFANDNGQYPFFTCSEEIYYCNKYAFDGKAILIAGNGNLNVKLYEGKFNAYQRTYVLIANDIKYYSMIFYTVQNQLKRLSNSSAGSIIKFITKGDVDNIQLVLPVSGHDELFNKLNAITKLIEKNKKQTQHLIQLRDFLLPMLMNGQVSVK
jgi:type I restriction enzyme, S subunit